MQACSISREAIFINDLSQHVRRGYCYSSRCLSASLRTTTRRPRRVSLTETMLENSGEPVGLWISRNRARAAALRNKSATTTTRLNDVVAADTVLHVWHARIRTRGGLEEIHTSRDVRRPRARRTCEVVWGRTTRWREHERANRLRVVSGRWPCLCMYIHTCVVCRDRRRRAYTSVRA